MPKQNERVVTLPGREEMRQRLMAVTDIEHAHQKFIPLLLARAGEEKVAGGIVLMFLLAVEDYTEGLPGPIVKNVLYRTADKWIDAICPDAEVATETKRQMQEALSQG